MEIDQSIVTLIFFIYKPDEIASAREKRQCINSLESADPSQVGKHFPTIDKFKYHVQITVILKQQKTEFQSVSPRPKHSSIICRKPLPNE